MESTLLKSQQWGNFLFLFFNKFSRFVSEDCCFWVMEPIYHLLYVMITTVSYLLIDDLLLTDDGNYLDVILQQSCKKIKKMRRRN